MVNVTLSESLNDNHQMIKCQSLGNLCYNINHVRDFYQHYLFSFSALTFENQGFVDRHRDLLLSHIVALHLVNVSLNEDCQVLKYLQLDQSML